MNNRRMMMVSKKSSRLPSEYQEVEYIQSQGNQYINSGIVSKYTLTITGRFAITDLTQNRNYIIGCYGLTGSRLQFSYSQQCFCGWGDSYSTFDLNIDKNLHTFQMDQYAFKLDNDVIYTGYYPYTFGENISAYLFALSAIGPASSLSNGVRIYSLKCKDSGTDVRDFVPCYRKSDGEIGMYDLVTSAFFTNSGTGTFIKGPNV